MPGLIHFASISQCQNQLLVSEFTEWSLILQATGAFEIHRFRYWSDLLVKSPGKSRYPIRDEKKYFCIRLYRIKSWEKGIFKYSKILGGLKVLSRILSVC